MNFIKKNLLLMFIVILVLVGGGFLFANQNRSDSTQTSQQTTQEKTNSIKVTVKADSQEKNYQVENAVGKTALEVTKLATSDLLMSGEGQNAFITSINGREAETSKKEFWKLVINGADAQVGAGSYTVQSGNTIIWEIDTY